ncbi:MAG: hypothetical protein ACLGHQ_07385, partial [Acidimicrobiia bacterium]
GGVEHHVVTGPDGRTGPVGLPFGTYEICERARPDWAVELVDTGCRSVEIDPSALEMSMVEVEYVNEVPTPIVDTRAVDPLDGDQVMSTAGGPAVDRVRLTRLVPGTRYRLVGHLVGRAGEPTGVRGELVIDAVATSTDVELHLDVPPLAPGEYVIVERLEVVAGGESVEVALHDDLADRDQTLTIVAPSTTTTTSTTSTTTTTTIPSTTIPSTTTSTTSPTTSTSTTTTTIPTTVPTVTASTLPRTGSDEALGTALRIGDLAFVAGVAFTALAGVRPRRRA